MSGLEGVEAADSAMSFIDGQIGLLEYRGIRIEDLAENSTFEETAYLLWYGTLPTRTQLGEFMNAEASERSLSDDIMSMLRNLPKDANAMETLRTAVSLLSVSDPDEGDVSEEANFRKGIRIMAKMPTIVAAFERLRRGEEPIAPNKFVGLAKNFLYMLSGDMPRDAEARAMDLCLVLHADHGFNASTFTGRVITATQSDVHSAVTGAIGALKGPLHGGAAKEVMKAIDEVGSAEKASQYVDQVLARKGRIMGIGHRVYKVTDPRAIILRNTARQLGEIVDDTRNIDILDNLAKEMEERKNLFPNVDLYSGTVYTSLGITNRDLYTALFSMSRVSGWLGHCFEQYKMRLIRPRARYIGLHEQPYIPMGERF